MYDTSQIMGFLDKLHAVDFTATPNFRFRAALMHQLSGWLSMKDAQLVALRMQVDIQVELTPDQESDLVNSYFEIILKMRDAFVEMGFTDRGGATAILETAHTLSLKLS